MVMSSSTAIEWRMFMRKFVGGLQQVEILISDALRKLQERTYGHTEYKARIAPCQFWGHPARETRVLRLEKNARWALRKVSDFKD
jgi:hypothetical protein